jgi:hypothetical protein
MPSRSTLAARGAHLHSRRAGVIAFASCMLAAQVTALPAAHAEENRGDDAAHGGISGSAGLDAFVAASPGEGVGAALRPYLQGEAWVGWTAPAPQPGESFALFPGPTLDRRRGLIVAVDAAGTASARTANEGSRTLDARFSEGLTLQLAPILLRQRASYQRPVDFEDGFWRSQRGVFSVGGGFEMPALLLLSVGKTDLRLLQFSFDGDWLRFATGATAWDIRGETTFIEHLGTGREGPRRVAVMDAHIGAHLVPVAKGAHYINREAVRMQIDLASLAGLRIAESWSFGLSGGIGVFVPAHFTDATKPPVPGTPDPNVGPQLLMPTLFADLVHRTSADPFVPAWSPLAHRYAGPRGPGVAFGAGTFQRLDPTGGAVDVGGQVVAEARLDLGRGWFAGANAFGATARRMVVTDLGLPAGAPGRGSLLFLGRLDGHVDRTIAGPLVASASTFVEHSDRDDPIGLGGPLPVRPRLRMGALLSLSAVLR